MPWLRSVVNSYGCAITMMLERVHELLVWTADTTMGVDNGRYRPSLTWLSIRLNQLSGSRQVIRLIFSMDFITKGCCCYCYISLPCLQGA